MTPTVVFSAPLASNLYLNNCSLQRAGKQIVEIQVLTPGGGVLHLELTMVFCVRLKCQDFKMNFYVFLEMNCLNFLSNISLP